LIQRVDGMSKKGWIGKNGKYQTMKKITCKHCDKKFYNNGFSTHEWYCKRKHQDNFINCKRVYIP